MLRVRVPKVLYLIALFPLTLWIAFIASRSPSLVERYYSRYVYRYLSQGISGITGIFPFSVAEITVIAVIMFIITGTAYNIIRVIKNPGKRLPLLFSRLIAAAVIISTVYFGFVIIWGLNYHRLPIADIANLEIKKASKEELKALCEYLIHEANSLRELMLEDENGIMISAAGGVDDILIRAQKGYREVAKHIPELGGKYGRPKGVMLSTVLSYQGIGGIYFPFTGEANVNTSGPHFMIPFTASHEMAHQRGIAKEDEANYIGYLACIMHPDRDFQYSGTMAALRYSMNALARRDRDEYDVLKEVYNGGVQRDFDAWYEHCSKYEGYIKRTADRINDAYLQANAQSDGVQSYGRMVDLLLAHYRGKLRDSNGIQ